MSTQSVSFISLNIVGEIKSFRLSDIEYFQSYGNYIRIKTNTALYCSLITTKKVESLLPGDQFIRIHKSYIINRSKINSVEGDSVIISSEKLPIGKTYKQFVLYSCNRTQRNPDFVELNNHAMVLNA